jgi:hypothetical protein
MLVGVGDEVWNVCDVPAMKVLVLGDRHWYVYGAEPPDTLHENVAVWLTVAGFGYTETLTESPDGGGGGGGGGGPVNVAMALALLEAGLGWLSLTVHKAWTFPATEDVVCQVRWVPTTKEMGDRHS